MIKTFETITLSIIIVMSIAICPAMSGDVTSGAANIGFQLLEEPVNPRFIAMGNAGTALAGKGFSGYNPALPFLMKRTYLSAEYGLHPKADLKHAQLEAAIVLDRWFLGLSVHSESIDDIYETNWLGNLPSSDVSFSSQFTEVSLDLGFSQWKNFAFAVCVNALQDRIAEEYAYAFTVSAGAVVNPVPDRFYCGLSVLNIGIVTTPMYGADSGNGWGEGEQVPFNSRLGVAWKDVFKDIGYTLAFDVVYRNVRDRDRAFTRAISDRFTFPLGVEVRPVPPLAIRIGKRINLSSEVMSFGLGLDLDPLTVDASFVIPKLIDDTEIKWVTSITYHLRKPLKKTAPTKVPGNILPVNTPPAIKSDTAKPAIREVQDTISSAVDSIVQIPSDTVVTDPVILNESPDSLTDDILVQKRQEETVESDTLREKPEAVPPVVPDSSIDAPKDRIHKKPLPENREPIQKSEKQKDTLSVNDIGTQPQQDVPGINSAVSPAIRDSVILPPQ